MAWTVLAIIALLFIARNLPWHLDDLDQAKQAFVSFQMVEKGDWWFQYTPSAKIATKPPLAGWISALLFFATGWWEGAWRVPGLVCAFLLLRILWKEGERISGDLWGGLIAAGAFGLNLFAPRLAGWSGQTCYLRSSSSSQDF